MERVIGERDVQGDDVALVQQRRELDVGHTLHRPRGTCGRNHVHREREGALCDRLADSSHADDPERRSRELGTQHELRIPGSPRTAKKGVAGLDDSPRRREQQREGEISGRVGQHTRCVSGRDTPPRDGWHVEVVIADGHVCNDLQRWTVVEELVVHAVRKHGDQAHCVVCAREQLVAGRGSGLGPDGHVCDLGETLERISGRRAGDEDLRSRVRCHHSPPAHDVASIQAAIRQ